MLFHLNGRYLISANFIEKKYIELFTHHFRFYVMCKQILFAVFLHIWMAGFWPSYKLYARRSHDSGVTVASSVTVKE